MSWHGQAPHRGGTHLARELGAHALALARAHGCEPRPDCRERAQADRDLQPCGGQKQRTEDGEKRREVEREFPDGGGDLGRVPGHGNARRAAAHACGKLDAPLQEVELRLAGAGNPVMVDGIVHLGLDRQHQLGIPQRARPQDRAVLLMDDLPVEARQGHSEPRIGGLCRKGELPCGRAFEMRRELIQVYRELGIDAALHVAFEQNCQSISGEAEGDGGRYRPGDEQPQAQRSQRHPGSAPMT